MREESLRIAGGAGVEHLHLSARDAGILQCVSYRVDQVEVRLTGGSGRSHRGAELALELLRQGWRDLVTAATNGRTQRGDHSARVSAAGGQGANGCRGDARP